MRSLLWCTSHYTNDFCKAKAKEIREAIKLNDPQYKDFERVSIVNKIVERNREGILTQYNKIRLHYKQAE